MENKRAFTTQDFIISGILFAGVVLFFVVAIASIQNNYPDATYIIDEDFSETYNKLTEQTQTIDVMRNTSLSGEGLSFRGAFDVTFGSFFTIMSLTFGTLDLFGNMYTSLTTDFPFIDSFVLNQLLIVGLSIITVILIFRLVNAVSRNPV